MAWKNLIVERGVVTLLRVNRPDQRNAIDFATMDELEEALTILERDEALRALVLTGGGDTFVSGGDLKDFQVLVTAEDGRRMAQRMGGILARVSRLPVPVIAALNGPAVGGGTEVALACDLRVAATNAYFSFRQVTMGIMTAWGGAPRLLALLGFSRALYYLLTAERITPEQALQMGLVQRVTPEGQAVAGALELARQLGGQPPLAVRAIKRTLQQIMGVSFDAAAAVEVQEFGAVWASEDHLEAVDAYFAKRSPVFHGR
ncbi:MAG TPA: enoyl-CoA hydratase/isomerase family protein [Candidatus Binatia bacterium]|jgi:enoyl-CoA hydratase|nr:enoyl-CoA hydratase/isomerase family protein [Candidatus Binatia bacterium]